MAEVAECYGGQPQQLTARVVEAATSAQSTEVRGPGMTASRVEAFSDAVFAFAATLLVVGLRDPATTGNLGRGLVEQWPGYAAYIVSFVTIGIIWINHNMLFGHLRRLDTAVVFLNLLLLMVVAFIPFPTGLLASYVLVSGDDSHLAAAVYGMTMTVMGALFTCIWWRVVAHEHLLVEGRTAHHARAYLRRSLRGPVIYLAATAVSALSAPAALVAYACVAFYFALPGRTLTPRG